MQRERTPVVNQFVLRLFVVSRSTGAGARAGAVPMSAMRALVRTVDREPTGVIGRDPCETRARTSSMRKAPCALLLSPRQRPMWRREGWL